MVEQIPVPIERCLFKDQRLGNRLRARISPTIEIQLDSGSRIATELKDLFADLLSVFDRLLVILLQDLLNDQSIDPLHHRTEVQVTDRGLQFLGEQAVEFFNRFGARDDSGHDG